jgi:hypothetical protein
MGVESDLFSKGGVEMNGALGRSTDRRSLIALILLSLLTTAFIPSAAANIYRGDNGELITERNAVPEADLSHLALSYADFRSDPKCHVDRDV